MDRILIIEDEQGIRDTLKDILELSGYEVITASNGKLGYDAIIEERPDLVLCDVNMPELDGFDLLCAINQRLKDQIVPPFVFLTAMVEMKNLRHGMDLGADDYILKPFDHNNVLKVIRYQIDKRRKIQGSGEAPEKQLEEIEVSFGKLALPCDDGLILIPFDDIITCKAERAYCEFSLKDGKKVLVSRPMKEFEDILTKNNFVKVHKSAIVNIHSVIKYLRGKGGQLLMSDGSVVPVAIRKKESLMNILRS